METFSFWPTPSVFITLNFHFLPSARKIFYSGLSLKCWFQVSGDCNSLSKFIYFFHPKSVSFRLKDRYCCVFLFLSFWWASLFVIALNNGWLAARFRARGGSWLSHLTLGLLMAVESLLPRTLASLLAHSLLPRATRPTVIPAAAPHWLSHAESTVVGPPSRWLRPWRRVERTVWGIALPGYVFVLTLSVLKLPCASEALSLIRLWAGFHVGKVVWSGLWTWPCTGGRCSAAAPITGRLKETAVMFGVRTKEDNSENGSTWSMLNWRLKILPQFIQIQALTMNCVSMKLLFIQSNIPDTTKSENKSQFGCLFTQFMPQKNLK